MERACGTGNGQVSVIWNFGLIRPAEAERPGDDDVGALEHPGPFDYPNERQ